VVPVTGVSERGEAALSEQPPDKQPETGIVILYHGCHKNECRTIRSGDLGMNQDSILRYSSGCGERTRRRLGHRLPDVLKPAKPRRHLQCLAGNVDWVTGKPHWQS
jgi:hypothetical protein